MMTEIEILTSYFRACVDAGYPLEEDFTSDYETPLQFFLRTHSAGISTTFTGAMDLLILNSEPFEDAYEIFTLDNIPFSLLDSSEKLYVRIYNELSSFVSKDYINTINNVALTKSHEELLALKVMLEIPDNKFSIILDYDTSKSIQPSITFKGDLIPPCLKNV